MRVGTGKARALRGVLAGALAAVLGAATGGAGAASAQPAFDADRAWADLVSQVRIGPRPPGSEGSRRTRELIDARMRQAGWRVETQRFEAGPPGARKVPMANLVATLDGAAPGRIALAAHYDTKRIPGAPGFVGANDGASGVAVLLELARHLARRPRAWSYSMLFFDGEEAFGERIAERDGLFGSREMAARMAASGELERLRAFVLVDMVGDADLNLQVGAGSAGWLVRLLRAAAAEPGLGAPLDPEPVPLIDDHTPFVRRGLAPVLALIDFEFGARRSPGPHWHTEADDLRAVSAESLGRTGELLVRFLGRLEAELDARGGVRSGGRP